MGDMEVVAPAVHVGDANHRKVAGRDGPGAEQVVTAATRRAAALGAADQHVARPAGGNADGHRVRRDLPCLLSIHEPRGHQAHVSQGGVHVAGSERLKRLAAGHPQTSILGSDRVELDARHAGQLPADLAAVDCLSHERTSASTSAGLRVWRGMRR